MTKFWDQVEDTGGKRFPVVEIFGPTFQGEGADAGRRVKFIRFGFCDGATGKGPRSWCAWCDSMFAVDFRHKKEWEWLTVGQIAHRLEALPGPCRTLILSGGNPALHDLEDLIWRLSDDWDIWVETQGTMYRDWLRYCAVTVSPKPPSASKDFDAFQLSWFMEQRLEHSEDKRTVLKIPVDPDFEEGADLAFAARLMNQACAQYDSWQVELALSVVSYPTDTREVLLERWAKILDWFRTASLPDVRLLPQLHVLLLGHRRGV